MAVQHQQFSGMISNASPYALPPGAAEIQVNLTTSVPGQLTTRGGMLPVRFTTRTPTLLDVYPYEHEGKTYIIGLKADGELVALYSPALGDDAVPTEPVLTVSSGQVAVSYTYRYVDGSYGGQVDTPPSPPGDTLFNTLNGWPQPDYKVDAEALCEPDDVDQFDGGDAATTSIPPTVPPSGLCDL